MFGGLFEVVVDLGFGGVLVELEVGCDFDLGELFVGCVMCV